MFGRLFFLVINYNNSLITAIDMDYLKYDGTTIDSE